MIRRQAFLFVAASLVVLGAAPVQGQTPSNAAAEVPDEAAELPAWQIDGSHSQVGFAVRHFFTPVEGSFTDYDVELRFDPDDPSNGFVSVEIDAASVDTGNERRDDDLRGPQFFETDVYPSLSFVSREFVREGESRFLVRGDLTIRDVTHPVELQVELLGIRSLDGDLSRYGSMVAGLAVSGAIDRREFGVGSGRWAETVILGPDVTIDILLEAKLP